MNDNLNQLINEIIKFRQDRDWEQFHQLKDLLIGLNIEVSELQELFLWKSDEQVKNVSKKSIENEVADIFIFLIYICKEFDINLISSVSEKIKINDKKYPIDKSKGSNKKYDEL